MDPTYVEVVAVREVGPDTLGFELRTPPGFEARPGQFVQVRATVDGEDVTRHYSISSPRVDETFELTVGIDPEGTLTPWLAERTAGDTVAVDGPFGRVFYEGERDAVVLASGPGVGAAVGIAERIQQEGGDATVVYLAAEPVHERRLAELAAAGADVFVLGDPDGLNGLLETVHDRGQVFVYGFEPFVERVRAAIRSAGGDPADAKMENFG